MAETYRHAPLQSDDAIRLLDLLPSSQRDAPVRCEIRQVKLGRARSRYEALSYVWGDGQGSRPILCDGRELLVTPNCYDAMVQLRRRYHRRTLWIDAICIDQTPESETERNHQVKSMGQIYRNASTVLVWLGSESFDLTAKDHLLLWASMIAGLMWYNPQSLFKLDGGDDTGRERFVEYARPRFDKYQTNFRKLTNHQWFTRVWTVQEFAFARRYLLLSGANKIRWAPLVMMGWLLRADSPAYDTAYGQIRFRNDAHLLATFKGKFTNYSKPQWKGERFRILKAMTNRDWHDWEKKRWRFLKFIGDLDSKLPHDKIYGVYSIMQKMNIELPEPDYSKPIQDVTREFTRAVVSSTRSLDLITLGLPPATAGLQQSSWVPDYLTNRLHPDRKFGEPHPQVFFGPEQPHASNMSKAYIGTDGPGENLFVRGEKVGSLKITLAYHSEALDWDLRFKEAWQFREFVQVCRDWCHACSTLPNHDMTTTFPRPSFMGYDANTMRIWVSEWKDVLIYPNCRILEPQNVAACSEPSEDDPLTIITNYLNSNNYDGTGNTQGPIYVQGEMNYTAEWAFALTNNGLTGRAYRTCQKDDELWLLAGSSVPVVLRPAEAAGEFWYISPAYFHGLMEGEKWPSDGDEGLELISLV